jgi:carboxyl-terminal processing protease
LLLALLIITFSAGWFSNQVYSNSFNPSNQSQSYSNLIQQAWTTIDQHYVDRKAIDYKQMSYKAIQAMLDVLHDKGHTRFLTPAEVQTENQQLNGTFTGIGIYLRQDQQTKQIIIESTIPGAPAEKAGFKHGDIIVAVNGVSTKGKDIPGISTLIQGKAGTSVSITVQRPSTHKTLTITVVRAEIHVPNVLMHYIAQDHIVHIQIVQFASGVSNQLKDAINQAKKDGATKIILDLRENPGGYLNEAVDTASEFMQSGNVLLEQDSTGHRTPYAVTGNTVDTRIPMVVLIDDNTASAAEIVAGALQENHRAILIGEKTFGTGTVLEEFPLADGSAILLGTQEWLTPDGHFIRDVGISPNIPVKLGPNASPLTPNDENSDNMNESQILHNGDTQLIAGIQYLEKH